jgi:Skp family chaperone for outer membrane proteins
MAEAAQSARLSTWRRAAAVRLVALGLMLGLANLPGVGLVSSFGVGQAAAQEPAILVISRKRLLNETSHAQALLQAEIDLTARLQAEVDAIKADLAAEEQELARLRPTLDRAVFEARVAAFDSKIRKQRRESQEKAAALQNAFRAERLKLVRALDPLLETERKERGASLVLNADQVLTADPALDITDEAIARFNATVPPPQIPNLESLTAEPSPPSAAEGSGDAQTGQ